MKKFLAELMNQLPIIHYKIHQLIQFILILILGIVNHPKMKIKEKNSVLSAEIYRFTVAISCYFKFSKFNCRMLTHGGFTYQKILQ